MRNFKLTIEYDGTDFHGWQSQTNAPRTIQGEMEKVLAHIFKKPRVVLVGSGRTDRGVHARGQVAHFLSETDMPADEIGRALNFNLPPDITIHKVEEVSLRFHAQLSAKSKTYQYTILNRSYPSALDRRTMYYFPRRLDIGLMQSEAELLLGTKDFSSFANSDPSRKGDAVRTVSRLDIVRDTDKILITITADGFLYKMVRNIAGTLIEVGAGRFPPGSLQTILERKDRSAAGLAVPPWGLCLQEVVY